MGIDFSHGNAHWSYSGFHHARTRLAAVIGVNLNAMQGFQRSLIAGDTGQRPISWATVTDEIAPLLYHSDCDGELSPDECRALAPRLKQLVEHWPDDDYDKQKFLELAKGMEEAAAVGEPLVFT